MSYVLPPTEGNDMKPIDIADRVLRAHLNEQPFNLTPAEVYQLARAVVFPAEAEQEF